MLFSTKLPIKKIGSLVQKKPAQAGDCLRWVFFVQLNLPGHLFAQGSPEMPTNNNCVNPRTVGNAVFLSKRIWLSLQALQLMPGGQCDKTSSAVL